MPYGQLRITNRKASHNIEPRLGRQKVFDVYGNKKNGFLIPKEYERDHLTAGIRDEDEHIRVVSPDGRRLRRSPSPTKSPNRSRSPKKTSPKRSPMRSTA